jgi:erythromycin esterase
MPRYFTSQKKPDTREIIATIRQKSYRLSGEKDLQPLYDRIGNARIVMLGEASHGTHEYYTWRSHISKFLIENMGFNFIAVEGDWPDCYRINRYIKNYSSPSEKIIDVLKNFNRWPTWMWANWEINALADWLAEYNKPRFANKKVGFYGLDVYSLWESMDAIMQYLAKVDKSALKIAQKAYDCFEPYKKDEGQSYARASQFVPDICRNEVVNLLKEIRQRLPQYDGDHENVFNTEQNALVAVNAEKYYRAMIQGGPGSWNIRDSHMADTLDRLLEFHGEKSKAIVWEHNTHIGDARATDMINDGMYNIGELARSKHKQKEVVLVGFGSYEGTVIAGKDWGARMEEMEMPQAKKGSWEWLLHEAGNSNKLIIMDSLQTRDLLETHIDHRAIGVVYQPQYEEYGNYVPTLLPLRYDAFIFVDVTKALHPIISHAQENAVPETYPFGV